MVFIFIYFMNEQEIQLDIQNKQKQLEDLKAKILAEQKAEEKNKLEEEKKKLEEEIASKNDDLDKLKGTIDTVSADTEATYRLIVGTEMEKKMKDAGKTDIEIKEFAEKIDAVVRKFLDKELEGFSNKIKNPMCTGIQFAMMETLTAQ
jgi:predicted  nucleic acid-binding Zn-ribbon protein